MWGNKYTMRRTTTSDAEYAPRHDRKIRFAIILFCLAVAAAAQFIYFPFLKALGANGACREIFGQPGLVVLIYASFLPMPLILFALMLFVLPAAVKTLQSGVYPPPGRKTLFPVRIRRGRMAKLYGWLTIAYAIGTFLVLVYAVVLAGVYAERYHANIAVHDICAENVKK